MPPFLRAVAIAPEVARLYQHVVEDLARQSDSARRRRVKGLGQEITALEEQLFKVDEMYVSGALAADSYARLKARYDSDIAALRLERADLEVITVDLAEKISVAASVLSDLGRLWRRADTEGRTGLLSSIFPEKLVFDGQHVRTHTESAIIALFSRKIAENARRRPLERGRRLVR